MIHRPLLLAQGVGFREPTVGTHSTVPRTSIHRAASPRIEQGGMTDRGSWNASRRCWRKRAVGFVVGLVVPPYGLPSTDPTPPGFVAWFGCRWQPGDERRGLKPLLTGRGRLAPTTNSALGNSPLTPFPSRVAADSRGSSAEVSAGRLQRRHV